MLCVPSVPAWNGAAPADSGLVLAVGPAALSLSTVVFATAWVTPAIARKDRLLLSAATVTADADIATVSTACDPASGVPRVLAAFADNTHWPSINIIMVCTYLGNGELTLCLPPLRRIGCLGPSPPIRWRGRTACVTCGTCSRGRTSRRTRTLGAQRSPRRRNTCEH